MKTKFRVFDLLEIAEAIERRRARFYVQKAPLFEAAEPRDLCYKLEPIPKPNVKLFY